MKTKIFNRALHKYYRVYETKYQLEYLSRKEKLSLVGRIQTKNKINKRLRSAVITIFKNNNKNFITDLFCPECGCSHFEHSGNKTQYPEVYEWLSCIRCNRCIGTADNSPMYFYYDEDDEYSFIKRELGYFTHSDIDTIFDTYKIDVDKDDWDFKNNKLKDKKVIGINFDDLFK